MDLCIEIEGVTEVREILERKMCVRLDLGRFYDGWHLGWLAWSLQRAETFAPLEGQH
jgi:hypothetical protein